MKQIRPNLPKYESVNIYPLYDVHFGERIAENVLKEWRKEVLSQPNNYVILGGDLMNMALKNSKSDVYSEAMTPGQQLDKVVDFLTPIKDRILGAVPGNHEARMTRETSIDPTILVMQLLGLKHLYSPTSCLVWVKVGKGERQIPYSLFFYHGSGGGGTVGGKMNGVAKLENIMDSDVYVAGHTHISGNFRQQYIRRDDRHNNVSGVEHVFICSNDFVLWNGSYGEGMGMRPTSMAYPKITLFSYKRRIQVVTG